MRPVAFKEIFIRYAALVMCRENESFQAYTKKHGLLSRLALTNKKLMHSWPKLFIRER